MANVVDVDPTIWQAIAGPCSEFPIANSVVYYFPQGHVDEASGPLPNFIAAKPYILCEVTSVSYLANRDTEEVLASLDLMPLTSTDSFNPLPVPQDYNNNGIVSYIKIIQSSDVPPSEYDGFGISYSLPDALAELIFPPIDTQLDLIRHQRVTVTDLMGKEWELLHCYNPDADVGQKHTVIEGWGALVGEKGLLAGDTIVFVKKAGKIFVGIRRVDKTKVNPGTVADAIGLAMNGSPFTVVYTPSPSPGIAWCDFVVRSHIVDESMNLYWWVHEKRVRMAVETIGVSNVSWIYGTIRELSNITYYNLQISPFRALLIGWDQPERTELQLISPWQLQPNPLVPS